MCNKYVIAILLLYFIWNNKINAQSQNSIFEKTFSSIGVVVVNYGDMIDNDNIKDVIVYNVDKSIYATIFNISNKFEIDHIFFAFKNTIKDEFNFCKMLNDKYNFYPKEFYVSASVVEFECKNISKDYYEVYTNKEKGITKLLKINKTIFTYYPWDKYVLKFYVQFDNKHLYKDLNNDSQVYNKEDIMPYDFRPIEIKGEWMRVKSVSKECEKLKKNEKSIEGWIRWLNNNHCEVYFYSYCDLQRLKNKFAN